MSSGLIPIIKKAAIDAIEASQPTDLRYGKVVSINPLSIRITPQFTIPASILKVPKRLVEDDPLAVNDEVSLIKQKGGTSYYVLDKMVVSE